MKLVNIKFNKETIMKKEYMKPTMDVVEVKSCALLTGSLQVFDEEITGGEMLAPELEDTSVLFDE
jgi:hypothetical protein